MWTKDKFDMVSDVVSFAADTAVCECIKRSDMHWAMKMLVAIPWALQGSINLIHAIGHLTNNEQTATTEEES